LFFLLFWFVFFFLLLWCFVFRFVLFCVFFGVVVLFGFLFVFLFVFFFFCLFFWLFLFFVFLFLWCFGFFYLFGFVAEPLDLSPTSSSISCRPIPGLHVDYPSVEVRPRARRLASCPHPLRRIRVMIFLSIA